MSKQGRVVSKSVGDGEQKGGISRARKNIRCLREVTTQEKTKQVAGLPKSPEMAGIKFQEST